MPLAPPSSTLFPYTTLFRSVEQGVQIDVELLIEPLRCSELLLATTELPASDGELLPFDCLVVGDCSKEVDRKSTRLNSSHVEISYAVFCLKKKTNYACRWRL